MAAIQSDLERGLFLSSRDRSRLKGAASYAHQKLRDQFIPTGLQRHLNRVIRLWEDANA